MLLPLPVQVADPLERLHAAKKAMDQLKHSYQAHVFYGLLEIFGMGPSVLEQTALDILSRKASAVMTIPTDMVPYTLFIWVRRPASICAVRTPAPARAV